MGLESACTVVSAIGARSAVDLESVSTIGGAISARSAAGLKSASTIVYALTARSAAGLKSASTTVSALSARSAREIARLNRDSNDATDTDTGEARRQVDTSRINHSSITTSSRTESSFFPR